MALNLEKKLDRFEPEEEKREIVLTDDQQKLLLKVWRESPEDDPPSLKDLVKLLFPHAELDGRSAEGRAIRNFLATFGIKPPTNAHVIIGPYELTPAEISFIQNNIDITSPLEMCKHLWGKDTILCKEGRALKKHVDSIKKPEVQNLNIEIDTKVFSPPENYDQCLRLVNKYNHNILSRQDISERERAGIYMLIRYLHSPRFLKTITTFIEEENRNLFLSEFIRATYDKPDLSVDDLNLYISLCACYPLEHIALKERERLSLKMEEEMQDGNKVFHTTVEAINAKNDEYKEYQDRQAKLIKELNGSRAQRMAKHRQANASIISLVEYVREEKKRKRMIDYANLKKKAVRGITEELLTFKDIQAEIFGVSKMFNDDEEN